MSDTVFILITLGLISLNSLFIPELQQGWSNLLAIGFISGMAVAKFLLG